MGKREHNPSGKNSICEQVLKQRKSETERKLEESFDLNRIGMELGSLKGFSSRKWYVKIQAL